MRYGRANSLYSESLTKSYQKLPKEVNSEPRTGARPSFRLCVGLINAWYCFALLIWTTRASYDQKRVI